MSANKAVISRGHQTSSNSNESSVASYLSVISLLCRWSSVSGRSANWTDTLQSSQWFSSFTLCYYSLVWRFGREACMFYNHWRGKAFHHSPALLLGETRLFHTWRCAVNTNWDGFIHTYTHHCGGRGDQKSCLDWHFLTVPHSWCRVLPLSTRNNTICCAYSACRRVFYSALGRKPCWKRKQVVDWWYPSLVGLVCFVGVCFTETR